MRLRTLIALGGIVALFAYRPGVVIAGEDRVPEELSDSDWSGIRGAYEANRHAAFAVGDGYQARNPGQQWRTRFDGRGFVTTPDAGSWSWGLELVSYGVAEAERALSAPSCIEANGQYVEYEWDEMLTEWYVNDGRGLEHGYTLETRDWRLETKSGADMGRDSQARGCKKGFSHLRQNENLRITLAVQGSLRPKVSSDRRAVSFVNDSGAAMVNYSGLTVLDADGVSVPAWFEGDSGQGVAAATLRPGARGRQILAIVVDDSGARYPLTIDPIAQQAYLKASNTGAIDEFGYSVAVSGDTVVVGADQEDSSATGVNGNQSDNSAVQSGAAYVFVRTGTTWTQQAYLKASNTGANDFFGYSVAVSGDTVVVTAAFEDSSATGVNGNQADNSATNSGAAYVFVRNGTTWTQQAYLKASNTGASDDFGLSVALSGDSVVVGAHQEDSGATGVNGNQADNSASDSGAAYVFVRNGTTWSQQAYLKASNTGALDEFGGCVAMSGDTVVVGAFNEDSSATGVNGNQADNSAAGSGAAYVFVRNGTIWSQQAYLKASNTGAGDNFGLPVGLSGDTLVVGASAEASNATGVNGNQADNSAGFAGAAYVFVRGGTTWTQQAYLKASNTEADDDFGFSVAVLGDTVVVGAPGESSSAIGVNGNQGDNSASEAGAAYIFVRDGATWTQQAYLKASNVGTLDHFGWSVGVSGDTLVVAAVGEDSNATGVKGNQADNSATASGAAYIFAICTLDTDGDGVPDCDDVCPNTAPGMPVDCTGRPHRDCNSDCLVNGADVQCIVNEILNQ